MKELEEWFLENQRKLPWRENKTPYRVWISEVMLQQTQVSVVIAYFLRWMEQFPTIESLANASEAHVIKAWEGLGYYSRARNLHKAAKIIVANYQGLIPQEEELLRALPGFGPYTVGAVRSFAFEQKSPAVDGNVVRVLSRYFASLEECSKKGHYEMLTASILPDERPWITMEGLIELGAVVCKKKPNCLECPLMEKCKAYQEGRALEFPKKQKKAPPTLLKRHVMVACYQDLVLVKQEKGKKVMSGLYEFPYAEKLEELPLQLPKAVDMPEVKHHFTRYQATLYPALYHAEKKHEITGYEWHAKETLEKLSFSSGHRRVLKLFLELIRE
ncbi:A/G-specific adenine glycosylase [Rhabdochlamydiaceae symbiont of Dictyostelium giganteum]|uniref:A/G-specific adenine glycosylase n=1 Tax=Rhabdochlamydiaceae symbiont of Dictyostelium giganteum TaxID=3342349 RepID=UPI00384D39CA